MAAPDVDGILIADLFAATMPSGATRECVAATGGSDANASMALILSGPAGCGKTSAVFGAQGVIDGFRRARPAATILAIETLQDLLDCCVDGGREGRDGGGAAPIVAFVDNCEAITVAAASIQYTPALLNKADWLVAHTVATVFVARGGSNATAAVPAWVDERWRERRVVRRMTALRERHWATALADMGGIAAGTAAPPSPPRPVRREVALCAALLRDAPSPPRGDGRDGASTVLAAKVLETQRRSLVGDASFLHRYSKAQWSQADRQQFIDRFACDEPLAKLTFLCRRHLARAAGGDRASPGGAAGRSEEGAVALAMAPPTGALVFGPSGCAKSLIAALAADESPPSQQWFRLNASDLFGKYLGESEARLRWTFHKVREAAPSVLVVSDIETIAARRGPSTNADEGGSASVTRRLLAALLCELDGVQDNAGVFVVGLSSQPGAIDPAMLRQGRLECLVSVRPLERTCDVERCLRSYVGRLLDAVGLPGDEECAKSLMQVVGNPPTAPYRVLGCAPTQIEGLFRIVAQTLAKSPRLGALRGDLVSSLRSALSAVARGPNMASFDAFAMRKA